MMKDNLFETVNAGAHNFTFNQDVARVFDDMAKRSIPFYSQLQDLIVDLIQHYGGETPVVYDIGCATAFTLRLLYKELMRENRTQFKLIGFDNSPAMIEQANLLFANERFDTTKIYCREVDILAQPQMSDATVVNSLFTMQFVRPLERKPVLQHIYDSLAPGGLFIMGEKTVSHNPSMNRNFIDLYHRYKKQNGYSDTEVAAKREALENVLVPFRDSENISLLEDVGFQEVEVIWKWLNFSCYCAMKV